MLNTDGIDGKYLGDLFNSIIAMSYLGLTLVFLLHNYVNLIETKRMAIKL